MDTSEIAFTGRAPEAAAEFAEFSPVWLAHNVLTPDGVTLRKGAYGVIVHRHTGEPYYEVEFSKPETVLTLHAEALTQPRYRMTLAHLGWGWRAVTRWLFG